MDIFKKLSMDKSPLGQYDGVKEGFFFFPKLEGDIAPRMKFMGKEVLTWSLNNYLGLANHPEVRKVDAEAAEEWGLAYPMGARMMSGNTIYHEKFESQLAEFVGKPAGMLLNYGYQGIFSMIETLVDRRDVIVYDTESHACIVDGVRLHFGKRFVYPHNDMDALENRLKRAETIIAETGGGILVITEGVFGMSGGMGNLKDIAALKSKYEFRLLVDDAHGFGTMGSTGAGAGEEQGVQNDVDIYFSTFAKSMAGIGAFVAGDPKVLNYMRYNSRSQIFAKSLPMPFVIGGMKRLELLKTKPELKESLWRIVTALQSELRSRGFNLGATQSPVTPIFLEGGRDEAANLVVDLREEFSIFCSVMVYPVIPKGKIMLRIIPTAVHTLENVQETISAFEATQSKLLEGIYKVGGLAGVIAAEG